MNDELTTIASVTAICNATSNGAVLLRSRDDIIGPKPISILLLRFQLSGGRYLADTPGRIQAGDHATDNRDAHSRQDDDSYDDDGDRPLYANFENEDEDDEEEERRDEI